MAYVEIHPKLQTRIMNKILESEHLYSLRMCSLGGGFGGCAVVDHLHYIRSRDVNLRFLFLSVQAHKIKQEEGTEDDGERRAISQDETAHSGEEGSVLEEPMIDSPNNLQDVGGGAEAPPDAAIRLPNGEFVLCFIPHIPRTKNSSFSYPLIEKR